MLLLQKDKKKKQPTQNSNIIPKTLYVRKGDKSFFSLALVKPQLKQSDHGILRCFNTSL